MFSSHVQLPRPISYNVIVSRGFTSHHCTKCVITGMYPGLTDEQNLTYLCHKGKKKCRHQHAFWFKYNVKIYIVIHKTS